MQRPRSGILALTPGCSAQNVQGTRNTAFVSQLPKEGQAFLRKDCRACVVTLLVGEACCLAERLGIDAGNRTIIAWVRCRQELIEPAAPFAQMAAHPPETPDDSCQTKTQCDLLAVQRPAQHSAQVIVLDLQPREPGDLLVPCQVRLGLLSQPQKIVGVRPPRILPLATRHEPLGSVLP